VPDESAWAKAFTKAHKVSVITMRWAHRIGRLPLLTGNFFPGTALFVPQTTLN
jgi:hypothetical protein